MMLSKKRIASLFFTLALIAVFALVPMGVFASTDDQDRISIATSEAIYISWPSATADTGTAGAGLSSASRSRSISSALS